MHSGQLLAHVLHGGNIAGGLGLLHRMPADRVHVLQLGLRRARGVVVRPVAAMVADTGESFQPVRRRSGRRRLSRSRTPLPVLRRDHA